MDSDAGTRAQGVDADRIRSSENLVAVDSIANSGNRGDMVPLALTSRTGIDSRRRSRTNAKVSKAMVKN